MKNLKRKLKTLGLIVGTIILLAFLIAISGCGKQNIQPKEPVKPEDTVKYFTVNPISIEPSYSYSMHSVGDTVFKIKQYIKLSNGWSEFVFTAPKGYSIDEVRASATSTVSDNFKDVVVLINNNPAYFYNFAPPHNYSSIDFSMYIMWLYIKAKENDIVKIQLPADANIFAVEFYCKKN